MNKYEQCCTVSIPYVGILVKLTAKKLGQVNQFDHQHTRTGDHFSKESGINQITNTGGAEAKLKKQCNPQYLIHPCSQTHLYLSENTAFGETWL